MYLSEFQKGLVKKFKSGETYDIYKFIDEIPEINKMVYLGIARSFTMHNLALKTEKTFHVNTGEKIYAYDNDRLEIVRNKLSEFIFLCDKLEQIKLIRAIKLSEGANIKFSPVIKSEYLNEINHVRVNDVINQLAFERFEWQFLVSPAITKFIENDFLTDEEVHANLEVMDRRVTLNEARTSRLNTRNFAIASLFISLLASGVTIYFSQRNIELFTNERKISIVDDKTRADTNRVLLIGKEIIYDTVKVNDTSKTK